MTDEGVAAGAPDAAERERRIAQAGRIGRALTSEATHPAWRDARYLEWLATELRTQRDDDEPAGDADFRARGEALLARAQARRLGVARAGGRIQLVHELSCETDTSVAPLVELGVAAGVGRELWDEPAEQWVVLPTELPPSRYVALRVVGSSMTPLLHTGDTVLVRVGAELARDTVVVARHPDDGYVCKRVHRLRRTQVELASLEAGRPLIVIPRRAELFVGTVVMVWCEH